LSATDTLIDASELWDYIATSEGLITQYYGRIGQGKTYLATRDVLKELSKGAVVYTNWKINYNGYDQRNDIWYIVLSLIFPFRSRFIVYPKDNLRHIDVDEGFIAKFEKLTDCSVYLDEGHVVFDSYQMAKMSLRDRKAVLHTRHFDRSIHIISQRPTAVHVSLRANVNKFFKCERLLKLGSFIIFRRTEFQDMTGETVDENEPISQDFYFGRKSIMNAYDSKYLRGNTPTSQSLHIEAHSLNYRARVDSLGRWFGRLVPSWARGRPKT